MVLTEAMSGGRPFVSTPVGGIPELARGNGILVPADDDVGLAKCLIDLLADPQLARTLGVRPGVLFDDAERRGCGRAASGAVSGSGSRELKWMEGYSLRPRITLAQAV
jgi:glycosyltransferase involved in cell wall biosynthesis